MGFVAYILEGIQLVTRNANYENGKEWNGKIFLEKIIEGYKDINSFSWFTGKYMILEDVVSVSWVSRILLVARIEN